MNGIVLIAVACIVAVVSMLAFVLAYLFGGNNDGNS